MMAKCKDCLHMELCARDERLTEFSPEQEALCQMFIDRNRYVVREKGEWIGWHGDRRVGDDEFGMSIYRHYHYYQCRKCGRRTAVRENFCPNCGADMRKGENG